MTQRAFQPDHSDAPEGYHDPDRNITLLVRDCLTGMRESFTPGSVDVIVTSPPYNLGISYGVYDDSIPRDEYLSWLERVGLEVRRVLADDGSFFLNLAGKPSDRWGPHEVLARLRPHFVLQNEIHIISSVVIDAATLKHRLGPSRNLIVGQHKPINSNRFLNDTHQYLFHLTKTGAVPLDRLAVGTPFEHKSNIDRFGHGDDDRRCRGNVWVIPYPTIQNRQTDRPHPASFPVELPRRCVRLHGVSRTRVVLDPFAGLGNSVWDSWGSRSTRPTSTMPLLDCKTTPPVLNPGSLTTTEAMTVSSRPAPTFEPRRCEGCGQSIQGKRDKRFCSGKCRAMASRLKRKDQMRTILTTLKDVLAELEELVGRE